MALIWYTSALTACGLTFTACAASTSAERPPLPPPLEAGAAAGAEKAAAWPLGAEEPKLSKSALKPPAPPKPPEAPTKPPAPPAGAGAPKPEPPPPPKPPPKSSPPKPPSKPPDDAAGAGAAEPKLRLSREDRKSRPPTGAAAALDGCPSLEAPALFLERPLSPFSPLTGSLSFSASESARRWSAFSFDGSPSFPPPLLADSSPSSSSAFFFFFFLPSSFLGWSMHLTSEQGTHTHTRRSGVSACAAPSAVRERGHLHVSQAEHAASTASRSAKDPSWSWDRAALRDAARDRGGAHAASRMSLRSALSGRRMQRSTPAGSSSRCRDAQPAWRGVGGRGGRCCGVSARTISWPRT